MTEQYTVDQIFDLKLARQNARFCMQDNIVLLTFDDNYMDQSVNLILSIAKHNPNNVSYICVGPMLKEENINTLLSLNVGIQVRCYDFSLDYEMGRWALSAVLRLFCPWLLSGEIHRVLYMDSDILCSGSLDELFNKNVACIAMCNEISGNVNKYQQDVVRKYNPTEIYCNSGVVVFNLDYLRTNYTFADIFTALNGYNGILHYLDQDFLNIYFKGQIDVLNAFHYNFQAYELYGTKYYQRALDNCRLIHFSVGKPWLYKSHPEYIRLYLEHSVYPAMICRIKKVRIKSFLYTPIRLGRRMLSPIKQALLAGKK